MPRLDAIALAVVATLSLLAAPALASEPSPEGAAASDPAARVDAVYVSILEAAKAAEDQAALVDALTTEMEGFVDYRAFAKRTLRRSWPDLTEDERTRFMHSFKELIIQTYAKRFKPGSAFEVAHRGEVQYRGEARDEAKVRTTITSGRVAADVDYYMRAEAEDGTPGWRTYDFEIDGASMALSWRRQFERIVQKDGFDALIAKIERQVADASGDDPEGDEGDEGDGEEAE